MPPSPPVTPFCVGLMIPPPYPILYAIPSSHIFPPPSYRPCVLLSLSGLPGYHESPFTLYPHTPLFSGEVSMVSTHLLTGHSLSLFFFWLIGLSPPLFTKVTSTFVPPSRSANVWMSPILRTNFFLGIPVQSFTSSIRVSFFQRVKDSHNALPLFPPSVIPIHPNLKTSPRNLSCFFSYV